MLEFIGNIFHTLLYQPLFNGLVFLYNIIPGQDFGISIILLTIIIRLILIPTSIKAVKSQKGLQKLQPQIQELQKKYKDDKEKQAKEILDLYKKEKINPFSGLFLAFLQLPILIALYQVFWNGLNPKELVGLYSFVANPGQINHFLINILDLSKPNFYLAVVAGLVQYFQTKMITPKSTKSKSNEPDLSKMMQKQALYFFPAFTVIILISLPSALGLYWTISGLFSIIQQYLIFKKDTNKTEI